MADARGDRVRAAAASGGVVRRPRLTSALRARFDHRLTLVTGPGGAGKTTVLTLAREENRLDPFGVDVWFAAGEHDRDAEHFARGLATAVGAHAGPSVESTIAAIGQAVLGLAPRDVVLLVDDVHLVDSPGSIAVLRVLLRDLPANGHLLLAGRAQPDLAVARLRAHHQVLDLVADDLVFDDDELAALIDARLHVRRGHHEPGDLPRLPALADLRLCAGPGADEEFLWEEVLDALGEPRRCTLRRAAVAEIVDDALVGALSDGTLTASELVDGLPLVERAEPGGYRLHAILRSALRSRSSPDELASAARLAGHLELARGRHRTAVELFARAGDTGLVRAAARRFALLPIMRRSFEDQLVVRAVLEATQPGGALGDLLRVESQSGELSITTDVTRLGTELAAVADRARNDGDAELEAVALYRAMVWISLDRPVPDAMVTRLAELAHTVRYAAQTLRFVEAERAMLAGDPETSLRHLAPIEGDDVDRDLELVDRLGQLCNLGRPEDVGVGLTTADLAGLPDGAELYVGFALWTRGQLTPEVALPVALSMAAQTLARQMVHPIVAILGVTTFMALALGDAETAQRHIVRSQEQARFGCSVRIRAFQSMAAAATALECDGEAAASDRLAAALDAMPMGRWPIPAYLLGLPMIYLLRPETRPALDACRFGHALTIARDAGVALAAVRERGEITAAVALPWDEEARLRAHVLPVHLCELAVAASLAGAATAESVLQRIPHLRRCLHRVAAVSSPIVAEAAAARLRTLPHRSVHRLSVSALGALQLVRDGAPVDDPAWERRARVRELMATLVEERRIGRETAATRCWPDLELDRALRNLRVTLTYLGRVLDPTRPPDAEPSVIRSVGDQLVLDEDVDVDVDRFDRLLARALDHDRAGAPSSALEGYREALASYRGEYLAGIEADWVTPTRTRLQLAALGAMLRAGELELASGEADRAVSWATRAIAISPGNERAGRLHASCLAALGDRVTAARELRAMMATLAAERLEPEPETQRLLRRIEGTASGGQAVAG